MNSMTEKPSVVVFDGSCSVSCHTPTGVSRMLEGEDVLGEVAILLERDGMKERMR